MTWSGKRVFVVVAVAWFALTYGPLALAQSVADDYPCLSGVPWHASFAWFVLEPLESTLLPMAEVWDRIDTHMLRLVSWYTLIALVALSNSLFWATLVTIAYGLIRRLRHRRAASKGV